MPIFATLAVSNHNGKFTLFSMKYFSILILFACLYAGQVYSQDSIQIRKNTLKDQISEAFDGSNSYQDYKVIKKTQLATLRRNILDSVSSLEKNINTLHSEISQQRNEVDSLSSELKNSQQSLANAKQKENGIEVLGINTQKSTYNIVMWSLIVILFFAAAVLFYKFLNTSKITSKAELKLVETEIELEEYRQNSIEREQILRRKLQDEINKHRKI